MGHDEDDCRCVSDEDMEDVAPPPSVASSVFLYTFSKD